MPQQRLLCLGLLLVLILGGCRPSPTPTSSPVPSHTPMPAPLDTQAPPQPTATDEPPTSAPTIAPRLEIPYELVSLDAMIASLEHLTAIQAYSGYRNGGSQGEAEAHDFVEEQLGSFAFLKELGLEIERQTFPVYLAVELWETRLHLAINGEEIEVPVNGLRGSRYQASLARNFDSDGGLNDSDSNPVVVSGTPLLVRDVDQLYELKVEEVEGRVLFLDYTLIDTTVNPEATENAGQLQQVISYGPAGLVLVTQYSNVDGESRGTVLGDGGVFQRMDFEPVIPILHARVEDMAPAGITDWDGLHSALAERIQSARLTWDADVFSPGWSGNLVARIPGVDPSAAVILGAHIDSPNGPGAFDNGSGAVIMLEMARVLEEAHLQPPVDLYLVWFGSHELGIYGSAHFAATHQELLDRSLAMLSVDCLGYPMEGHNLSITLDTWTYGQFGDDRPVWPDYLIQTSLPNGLLAESYIEYGLISDNSNFVAFDVPNADMIYVNMPAYERKGSGYLHYAAHLHDPYETVDLVHDVGEVLLDMARIALTAALQTGYDRPDLRVAPQPERRALLVGSHTQTPDLAPTLMAELGMALAWQGFDVDLIPFGQPVTSEDLQSAGLVLLLPAMDYPGQDGGDWLPEEIDALESYVKDGGFLVVTNSYNNAAMLFTIEDVNEDSRTINALTERFGVAFQFGTASADMVLAEKDSHPLVENASYLEMFQGNGVPFSLASGVVLAKAGSRPVLALLDYGDAGGQVLLVADIGLLSDFGRGAKNLTFLQNLARYAWER